MKLCREAKHVSLWIRLNNLFNLTAEEWEKSSLSLSAALQAFLIL